MLRAKKASILFDKRMKFQTGFLSMTQECPQLQNLPANVRKFWDDKQQALHDTLQRFSYGVLVESADVMLRETSGLLYLMRQNLWFEDFPKSSVFSSLFQQNANYTKTLLQFPVNAISEVRLVPSSELARLLLETPRSSGGFFSFLRIFSPKQNALFLSGKDATGRDFKCAFRDLDDPGAWHQTLSLSGNP
jgi:hypothetical protein